MNKKTVSQIRSQISATLAHPSLEGVTFRLNHELTGLGYLLIRFHREDGLFTVWHDVGQPNEYAFYMIAPYHPVMRGLKAAGSINGSTDAFVRRGSIIHYVFSPDSINGRKWPPSLTWHHMQHPFYARGQSIMVEIDHKKLAEAESQEELQQLLLALVEHNGTYLDVSSGFIPPVPQSQYIADKAGIKDIDSSRGEARGSEAFCVWAYHILQAEGQLENAFIPEWFAKEGWLEAYRRFGGE